MENLQEFILLFKGDNESYSLHSHRFDLTINDPIFQTKAISVNQLNGKKWSLDMSKYPKIAKIQFIRHTNNVIYLFCTDQLNYRGRVLELNLNDKELNRVKTGNFIGFTDCT